MQEKRPAGKYQSCFLIKKLTFFNKKHKEAPATPLRVTGACCFRAAAITQRALCPYGLIFLAIFCSVSGGAGTFSAVKYSTLETLPVMKPSSVGTETRSPARMLSSSVRK